MWRKETNENECHQVRKQIREHHGDTHPMTTQEEITIEILFHQGIQDEEKPILILNPSEKTCEMKDTPLQEL